MPNRDEKIISELVRRMNETSIRIKDLESRIGRLERELALLQENAASKAKELKAGLDGISNRISEAFRALEEIKTEQTKTKKLLESFATKVELKEMEKFIELISPMTREFVTKGELEDILKEKLKKI